MFFLNLLYKLIQMSLPKKKKIINQNVKFGQKNFQLKDTIIIIVIIIITVICILQLIN